MKGNNQAYKLWLCLLCSFLLLPLEIQAQEKGDSITGKVHKIDEVTVNFPFLIHPNKLSLSRFVPHTSDRCEEADEKGIRCKS